jgi:chaperonin cofactor prefoldin
VDEDLRKAIESSAAETRRHFDTVGERLESKLETVAEGVVSANERLERFQTKMHEEFDDVRSMIRFSHHELDRRMRLLEETVSDLQTRVERLESSTH